MSTLSNALHIGLTGMRASQQGLNVAGHNIANVSTEGYTRQIVEMASNNPLKLDNLIFGSGVNVQSIIRVRDEYLDRQFRDENQLMGSYEKQAESVELIEAIINEPSDSGLQQAIEDFFASLQDLADNPESSSVRTTVSEQGSSLATTFNQTWDQLENIRDNKNLEIIDQVAQINELLDQVADLNVRIGSAEALGDQANDLRDKRDAVLDNLSRMVDIKAEEDPNNGMITVSLSGQAVVVMDNVTHIEAKSENIDGKEYVSLYNPETQQSLSFAGGELQGLVEVRDSIIPEVQEYLDTLAISIIDEFNAVHRTGYGLQGNRDSAPTNIDFFEGESASTMTLNTKIVNDPGNIAASGSGAAGDNENALALAMLRDEQVLNNGQFSFEDYWASAVSSLGLKSSTISERLSNQQALVENLENFRESVSGVNLDEELINLVKFQNAFGANARVITTTNEMLGIVVQLGKY